MSATPTKTTSRKKAAFVPASVTGPQPAQLNDTRADDEAVLGHFVEVTAGEHEGRYGVFIEAQAAVDAEDQTKATIAVVRARDNDSDRFSVPIADLVPAEAGRR